MDDILCTFVDSPYTYKGINRKSFDEYEDNFLRINPIKCKLNDNSKFYENNKHILCIPNFNDYNFIEIACVPSFATDNIMKITYLSLEGLQINLREKG